MSTKSLTKLECQKIIFNLGIKFGVSPKLISTRMLSPQDKWDMLNGDLSIEALELCVKSSMANGMFITDTPLQEGIRKGSNRHQSPAQEPEPLREKCHYRKPFVCHHERIDCHCRSLETA